MDLRKGEIVRKGWIIVLLLLIVAMTGCKQDTVTLPELHKDNILVTHVKKPLLTVIDRAQQEVVHEEQLNFIAQSLARVNNEQLVLASQGEPSIRMLNLADGTIRTLDLSAPEVTCLYVDDARQLLFIAEAEHEEVIVFDLESETVLHEIEVGRYPNAMDVNGQFLNVLHGDEATVSVVDLFTYEVVHTFPVVGHPTSIIATDDTVWVGGHGATGELNKHVHVYEAQSGELLAKIQAGTMPIALYHDAHSEDMFVLSHGSNELHVIDLATMAVKERIPTGDNPFYLTGDKQFIYVTALDGNELLVIDRQRYEVVERYELPAGPYGIILGGDRR